MLELYLFILTLAIGYYYESSVKEYDIANKPLKFKQRILKIDKNNPYKVTIQKEIEIEDVKGVPDGGIVYTETINYLERPFEEWPCSESYALAYRIIR